MSRYQECSLCGVEGPQVRVTLVEWLEPSPLRFSVIPRCSAVTECRARVLQAGEPWPLSPTKNEAEVLP